MCIKRTPDAPVVSDAAFESKLYHMYREACIARDNFKKQRNELRAKLKALQLRGQIKQVARQLVKGSSR
jgi:hypothetical protein